jgi:hypothetical protein
MIVILYNVKKIICLFSLVIKNIFDIVKKLYTNLLFLLKKKNKSGKFLR